ncbi:MAG: DUF3299 domain-containing protein [Bacteroidia bacterium]
MNKALFLSIIIISLLLTACTESNTSPQAPEDPTTIQVANGIDSIRAAYDQGTASIVPGYIAISWIDLSDVEFEDRFYEEVKSYLLYPKFGDRVKALSEQDITLAGFVISAAADSNVYVLSANPLASCFFCGAAGPESVVQLNLAEGERRFQTDEWVTFKGTLRLNDSNIDELNYILEEAKEIEE